MKAEIVSILLIVMPPTPRIVTASQGPMVLVEWKNESNSSGDMLGSSVYNTAIGILEANIMNTQGGEHIQMLAWLFSTNNVALQN